MSRPYFKNSNSSIRIETSEGMREAQLGAYWAVRSHFTVSSDAALAILPTGAGKTALMTLLGLAMIRNRLLIVVPSTIIREQIADEFHSLNVLKRSGCIDNHFRAPHVKEVKGQLSTKSQWNDLEDFDVVVGTPKCLSPAEKGVFDDPPREIFDFIFFDEGQHLPATTWDNIAGHFVDSKIVTFTATPFRRDQKPIPGVIVFNYSISKAIESGIYRPIEFIAVEGLGSRHEKDLRLAQRAKEILMEEGADSIGSKLLVRVGRISDAKGIQELYASQGLSLEIVSSRRSLGANQRSIRRVREKDDCHGVIAIGMLGEGLNLPLLGIAVMHAPHQSFPATLQFIGRICRMGGEHNSNARLLAIPEDVQDHTSGLFDLDADWATLIPEIADAAVEEERERRLMLRDIRETEVGVGLSPHSIHFPFNVRVYQLEGQFAPDKSKIRLYRGMRLVEDFVGLDGSLNIYVFELTGKPRWSTSEYLLERVFELVAFYQIENYLFELSTLEFLGRQVRESDSRVELSEVKRQQIEKVISQNSVIEYYNLGLRRAAHASTAIPAYKILAGRRAQDALRHSDGGHFAAGHAFGRVVWNESETVIGVSTKSGKVWSPAYGQIQELVDWCAEIARRLKGQAQHAMPFMEDLKRGHRVTKIPAEPYAADLPHDFFERVGEGLAIELSDGEGNSLRIQEPDRCELQVVHGSWSADDPQRCSMQLVFLNEQVSITVDLSADRIFAFSPDAKWKDCVVKVPDQGRLILVNIAEYFSDSLPVLYLSDGSALEGRYHFPYSAQAYSFPDDFVSGWDWDTLECDITVEDRSMVRPKRRQELEESGKRTVLEATQLLIPKLLGDRCLAFQDHKSGEIADYVGLKQEGRFLAVSLIHCKASSDSEPGARQKDAYAVFAQARKCVRWINRTDFLDVIRERITDDNIALGTRDELREVLDQNARASLIIRVYAVQPGFDVAALEEWSDESIRLLALSLYDELLNEDVDFRIVGSNGD